MVNSATKALAELDKALALKPEVDGHVFSTAAHFLALQRDAMAAQQRRTGATSDSRRSLEHVNAVISVVLAAHFPLGSVPWAELKMARGWLAELTDQTVNGE